MVDDKYIGLGLAISSSAAIGTSFIITKKGLMDAQRRQTFAQNDEYAYLKNPIWWAGMITMIIGEIANFAAYTFAPAILVTPLGALSVLVGAMLASVFLKEELGPLGRLGCAICLIGSIVIVLHAPEDKDIQTVDEILNYAVQPGFLFYCFIVTVFATVMIYRVAPLYGRRNPLVYLSICSTVGSVSVMSIKAFGIALKLTLAGNNQFTHPSTYAFAIVVAVCILTQMNYFNKALDQFPTSLVNPIYYVTFTTCTLCASFILFQGFNTTSAVDIISLLCGFLIIFAGVYLLNFYTLDASSKHPPPPQDYDGLPLGGDMLNAGIQARRSIQLDRSRRSISGQAGGRRGSVSVREARLAGFVEEEEMMGLAELHDSEEEEGPSDSAASGRRSSGRRGSMPYGK
ncbi:hypothetical protein YB2330_000325 [Saitoella coloradoensis]